MDAELKRAYANRSIDATIGENVHTLMWRNGDTQLHVAPLLGMTQGALSNKLRGKRPWFASEIDAIATRYDVTRDELFGVGPTGIEPMTSTVDYGRLAPVTPIRRVA